MTTSNEPDVQTVPAAVPLRFEADRWYTPDELAAITPWSTASFAAWRCAGSGPAYTKIGRRIFYRGGDLAQFFTDRLRSSTAEQAIARPSKPFAREVRS